MCPTLIFLGFRGPEIETEKWSVFWNRVMGSPLFGLWLGGPKNGRDFATVGRSHFRDQFPVQIFGPENAFCLKSECGCGDEESLCSGCGRGGRLTVRFGKPCGFLSFLSPPRGARASWSTGEIIACETMKTGRTVRACWIL